MSETLHWIELIISSGLVVAIGRTLLVVGRLLQKQDDHDKRLDTIENRLNFPQSMVH